MKEGALQKGQPEARAVPNVREGVPQKGVILFFMWMQADKPLIRPSGACGEKPASLSLKKGSHACGLHRLDRLQQIGSPQSCE